jgi:hypothetical protein
MIKPWQWLSLMSLLGWPRGQLTLLQGLDSTLEASLEIFVVLLSFTLAIFVLLVFAVRALMIFRKLPVPTDPLDMALPGTFRALMLIPSALIAPLVGSYFAPVLELSSQSALFLHYGLELVIAVGLWFLLELFYRLRQQRSGPRR